MRLSICWRVLSVNRMTELAVGYLEGTGGVRVFYRAWETREPAGSVLFVHGLGEHGGRYDRLAQVVASLGLDLYAIDLRGHGRSQGRRGHVPDFTCFLRDLDRLRRRAGRETTGRATFLVGHSLGGLVVGRYAEAFAPDGLRGVAFVAPFVETEMQIPGWKRSLGAATDRLARPRASRGSPRLRGSDSRGPRGEACPLAGLVRRTDAQHRRRTRELRAGRPDP